DLHDLARVFRNPDCLFVSVVVSRNDLYFVSVEGAGRNRNTFRTDNLQLLHLRLLLHDVEIAERKTVALREWQRGDHVVRSRAVREQSAASRSIDWFGLAVHRHRPAYFVGLHVEIDGHRALLDKASLEQQSSLFDGARVGNLTLRRHRGFVNGPRAVLVLDLSLDGQWDRLTARHNRRLVIRRAGL